MKLKTLPLTVFAAAAWITSAHATPTVYEAEEQSGVDASAITSDATYSYSGGKFYISIYNYVYYIITTKTSSRKVFTYYWYVFSYIHWYFAIWWNKVTEYTDGRKTNTGTYKLSGQKLEIEINGYFMIANLSDDKKTFTVESATGVADLAKGYKYTKSDE